MFLLFVKYYNKSVEKKGQEDSISPTTSDAANFAIKKGNITKNKAVKEYFPAVFYGKIDTAGKAAIATFFCPYRAGFSCQSCYDY